MASNAEVKCSVHGTHGNLSNGKCWWCVQSGMTPPGPPQPSVKKKVAFTSTVQPPAGTKRKIG